MSILTYHKAFSIQLRHEYFTDEFAVNSRVSIEPTASCEELLARGRMVFRNTGKGAMVMYRSTSATSGTPSVELKGKQIFNFKLKLNDTTEFLNVTDMDLGTTTYSPENPVLLKYTANPPSSQVSLSVEFTDGYRSPRFSELFSLTGGSNTVEVFDITGTLVQTQTITSGIAASRQVLIDLSEQPAGYYEVRFTDSTSAVTSRRYFVGDDIQAGEVLAMISICYPLGTPAPLYTNNAVFDYEFLAKQLPWKFYILPRFIESSYFDEGNKPTIDVTELTVGAPSIVFAALNNSRPVSSITIGGINPIVFQSAQNIPLREERQYRFTLNSYKNPTSTQLINSLPQPDHSRPSSNPDVKEIFYYLDRLMIPV
ncbi:MAG: T9SS type A sorting domain-containing protein [Bacteroidetes bacterium]|nr:T9SS type A sorting domain-containing protein [Bacteroidota bacterium]